MIQYDIYDGVHQIKTKTHKIFMIFSILVVSFGLSLGFVPGLANADTFSTDFESPTYTTGDINGQQGWSKTGNYDVAVDNNSSGFLEFGNQSLRMSDAITTGSFGDQTFAPLLNDSVGETSSTAGSFSTGTKQRRFEMQFDFASAAPDNVQTGLHTSISPDRGDGSRMSYLRLEDSTNGINVFFSDVKGSTPQTVNFDESQIATDLSRSEVHTLKLTLDTIDGPSNDVVKVWIDGNLVKTGTSWENYYRYDTEASAEQTPRIVKTVLFRESGDANTGNSGKGFLFDNLSMRSGPILTKPDNKDQCKNNGWKNFNDPTFKNQGACVSWTEHNVNNHGH